MNIFYQRYLYRCNYTINQYISFPNIAEIDEIAGVVSELEKHGYSSEEIFKAIDLTGTTDTKALMNSMICKLKSSASMYDYSIVFYSFKVL